MGARMTWPIARRYTPHGTKPQIRRKQNKHEFCHHVNILLYASDTSSPYSDRPGHLLNPAWLKMKFLLGMVYVMSYLRIATHPAVFDHPCTR